MNGQKVMFKLQVKYLGVNLDRKLNFIAHISYDSEKVKTLGMRPRFIVATHWDIRAPALKLLCDRMIVPTVTYVASVWKHRM